MKNPTHAPNAVLLTPLKGSAPVPLSSHLQTSLSKADEKERNHKKVEDRPLSSTQRKKNIPERRRLEKAVAIQARRRMDITRESFGNKTSSVCSAPRAFYLLAKVENIVSEIETEESKDVMTI